LKTFGLVVNRINTKKYLIRLARVEELQIKKQKQKQKQKQRKKSSSYKAILQEIVATQVLTRMRWKRVVLPLSAAIHPLWLIESTFKKLLSSNKIPWMPLSLPIQCIYEIAKELWIDEHKLRLFSDQSSMIEKPVTFTKQDYAKYRKTIDLMAESALKNMKTVSFEIGPNYLHDILDSV
jgi:radical SAM superfamily enzyme with C-terminal helix-hairpin-helix motif